ncbi:MAG: glycoside-pentoside-hexuronide (GPH):cation symporter [Bacteroidota bacterium]
MDNISLKEKVSYGLGDFASSMFWKMFGVYLLFFYTDVYGITAAQVGTMFLLIRVFDGANDPVMGIIADRTSTQWGKFRPYLLWMCIPFAVFGILTFTTPDWSATNKLLFAYVTHGLMMVVYTAINVPYASLMGVMTTDSKDRTSLASYRFVFAFAGGTFVLASAEPLVDFFSSGPSPEAQQIGWMSTMMFYGVIAAVLFFFTFYNTRERVFPPKDQQINLKNDLKDLAGNRPWFILLGAGIFTLVFNSVRDGATIYYFKYYSGNAEALHLGIISTSFTLSTAYLVLGQMANVVGVTLSQPISNIIGKKSTFLYAMVLAAVLSLIFFTFDERHMLVIFIFQFLISSCAGIIFPILWSMYADIADYSEWRTGRRATGLIFSSSSMSQKLGWTIGGTLTGWILAYYGFEANIEQTSESKTGIKMMMSVIPAVGALCSALLILFYQLTDGFMEKVSADLEQKRLKIETN